jgi:8-oxo-dGTP pyrophosphatase MutT (NUDIX family)
VHFKEFISNLTQQLQKPLPGRAAHLKMMPVSRLTANILPNETTRKSAILILFYPSENEIFMPLILRPAYDGVHGGQMAFPGGQKEKEDENLIRTALRETQEEIGIKAIDVKVLGQLSEIFIAPSNFLCQPVVGYVDYAPSFYPDAREVDTIFEVNVNEILDEKIISKSTVKTRGFETGGVPLEVPCYTIQNRVVWGATAVMIAELLEVIKKM